jgi:hypothetical protein
LVSLSDERTRASRPPTRPVRRPGAGVAHRGRAGAAAPDCTSSSPWMFGAGARKSNARTHLRCVNSLDALSLASDNTTMKPGRRTLRIYRDNAGNEPFADWLESLDRGTRARAALARIQGVNARGTDEKLS